MQAVSNATAASGMALQMTKLQSEIDLNKSIAEANRADAKKKLEGDLPKTVAEIKNIDANTDLMYQQTKSEEIKQNLMDADLRYNRVRNEIQSATKDYQIERIAVDLEAAKWSIEESIQTYRSKKAGADVDEATVQAKIDLQNLNVKTALTEILVKNATIKNIEANTDLARKKIEEISNTILQDYIALRQENEKISVSKQELKTRLATTLMNNNVTMEAAKLDATVRLTSAYINAVTK